MALATIESVRPRAAGSWVSTHYLWLLAITILGAILRLAWLDHPALWGDEALTYGRVCGTFGQLLDKLEEAGFAPLHYELYWWIAQHARLTPVVMRLVPAIAGTLMVPSMYWLAVQLAGRRAALLTSLLTATSAYLLNYSRDAKMYSHFWLFCVLNMASPALVAARAHAIELVRLGHHRNGNGRLSGNRLDCRGDGIGDGVDRPGAQIGYRWCGCLPC